MSARSYRRRAGRRLARLAVAVAISLAAARLALPRAAPTLCRWALRGTPIAVESLVVESATFGGLRVSNLVVRCAAPAFRARCDRVELRARPWDLLRRRIRSLTVRGLDLRFDPPGAGRRAAGQAPGAADDSANAWRARAAGRWTVERAELSNARVQPGLGRPESVVQVEGCLERTGANGDSGPWSVSLWADRNGVRAGIEGIVAADGRTGRGAIRLAGGAGDWEWDDGVLVIRVGGVTIPAGTPVRLAGRSQAVRIGGTGELDVRIERRPGGWGMETGFALREGTAREASGRWELQGVAAAGRVRFADRALSGEGSAGFRRFRAGAIWVEDGASRWTGLSDGRLLAVEAGASVCGGTVSAGGLVLDAAAGRGEGVVRVDGARLEAVLGALGLTGVRAGGAVSGRLPFRYADGAISVEEGVLETAPGEKGRIQWPAGGWLTQWTPPTDSRSMYLRIVEDALADFEYDRLHLSVNARDSVVSLDLSVHGRPVGRLPYAFDTRRREWRRVRPGRGNVSFDKGIGLTIRLNELDARAIVNSPLGEFLRGGEDDG